MALYPPAIKKLIPPGENDPRIKPVGVVWHIAASLGDSLWDYFAHRSGGIESHFYVRKTGVCEQYRDTAFEADANLDGNSFYRGSTRCGLLSIEGEGLEYGEWTPPQLETYKAITVWAARTHQFPLQLIPAWNGDGVGYHTMWGAPSHWTPVSKTCPGPDRIKQFKADVQPWLNTQHGQGGGEAEPWPHLHMHEPITVIVKNKLHAAGYFNGPIDDYFGPTMRESVKKFQLQDNQLKVDPDGLFGPLTYAKVMALPDPQEPQWPQLEKWRTELRQVRTGQVAFNNDHPALANAFGREAVAGMTMAINAYNDFLDN